MTRHGESLNRAVSRRLAESNRCKAPERDVHVNPPEREGGRWLSHAEHREPPFDANALPERRGSKQRGET